MFKLAEGGPPPFLIVILTLISFAFVLGLQKLVGRDADTRRRVVYILLANFISLVVLFFVHIGLETAIIAMPHFSPNDPYLNALVIAEIGVFGALLFVDCCLFLRLAARRKV